MLAVAYFFCVNCLGTLRNQPTSSAFLAFLDYLNCCLYVKSKLNVFARLLFIIIFLLLMLLLLFCSFDESVVG